VSGLIFPLFFDEDVALAISLLFVWAVFELLGV
jgi:hypothetical protein